MATRDDKERIQSARTPEERFEALPPDRQAQLLDPAEAEFAQHGFERASLNRILERAGISKGQAYHYARDKAALYRLVVERAFSRIVAELGPINLQAGSADMFWNSLADALMRATSFLAANPELGDLARGIYPGGALPHPALAPLVDRIEEWLHYTVKFGQQAGFIRTDIPKSMLVSVAFGATLQADRWFAEHWTKLTPDEALERAKQSFDLFRNMLSPRSEPEASLRSTSPLFDEIEAQTVVLVPVLRTLRKEIGAERANALVFGAVAEVRHARSLRTAAQAGKPSIAAWTAAITDLGKRVEGTVDYKWLRQTPGALEYDVTSCAFAQLFQSLGEPELGKTLVCDIDTDLAEANAPAVELRRDQTLMEGGPCCTFRYKFTDRRSGDSDAG